MSIEKVIFSTKNMPKITRVIIRQGRSVRSRLATSARPDQATLRVSPVYLPPNRNRSDSAPITRAIAATSAALLAAHAAFKSTEGSKKNAGLIGT
jgi:hypothetical protein